MASSSERRSSISSQHSTHSIPRLSIDKRHSSDKRSSTDSTIRTPLPNLPGLSSLPGISSNSPLAPTGPRGMPPPTPPKDRLPPPQTPTRKPVQRQKSPLSSEAFSSASPSLGMSMPGTFPVTSSPGSPVGLPVTQITSTAYAGNNDSSPATTTASPSVRNNNMTPASKRNSSLRDFLPFKALRKSYDRSSSHSSSPAPSPQNGSSPLPRPSSSFGMRPSTPGAESMMSKSTNQSSLRKKMSGSFWRRKSGLLSFGSGDVELTAAHMNGNGDGSVSTVGNDTLVNDDNGRLNRSTTPLPIEKDEEEGGILRVKKRKSGTFWRRKSNLDLLDQYNGTNGTGNTTTTIEAAKTNGQHTSTIGHTMSGNDDDDGDGDVLMSGTDSASPSHLGYGNGNGNGNGETNGVTTMAIQPVRPRSPPPQLPEFIGGGGGLGLEAETMFLDS